MAYTKADNLVPGSFYYSENGRHNTWCYLGRNIHREFVWVRVTKNMLNSPTFTTVKQAIEKNMRTLVTVVPAPLRVHAIQQAGVDYYAPGIAKELSKLSIELPSDIEQYIEDLSYRYYTGCTVETSEITAVPATQFVRGGLYMFKTQYTETYVYLGRNIEQNCVWFRLRTVRDCKQFAECPTDKYIRGVLGEHVYATLAVTTPDVHAYTLPAQTATLRGLGMFVNNPAQLDVYTPEYLQGLCNTVVENEFIQAGISDTQKALICNSIRKIQKNESLYSTCKQTAYATYFYNRTACFEFTNRALYKLQVTLPLTVGTSFVQREFADNVNQCVYTCTDCSRVATDIRRKLRNAKDSGQAAEKVTYALRYLNVVHVFIAQELLNVIEQLGVVAKLYINTQEMKPTCVVSYIGRALVYPISTVRYSTDVVYDYNTAKTCSCKRNKL